MKWLLLSTVLLLSVTACAYTVTDGNDPTVIENDNITKSEAFDLEYFDFSVFQYFSNPNNGDDNHQVNKVFLPVAKTSVAKKRKVDCHNCYGLVCRWYAVEVYKTMTVYRFHT